MTKFLAAASLGVVALLSPLRLRTGWPSATIGTGPAAAPAAATIALPAPACACYSPNCARRAAAAPS